MELYFKDGVTTVSTIITVAMISFIAYMFFKQSSIDKWGRYILILAVVGLVGCCFFAVRDGYDQSVQAAIDSVTQPGLFTVQSIQSTVCCIAGAVIALSTLSSIFVQNQTYRKVMFFVLSSTILIKILVVEISRIVLYNR